MLCPKCQDGCYRDSVDVGVGVMHGPYGCPSCGWSESDEYDLSAGVNPVDDKGGVIDQYGGYHPPGSSMAMAYRLAEVATGKAADYLAFFKAAADKANA